MPMLTTVLDRLAGDADPLPAAHLLGEGVDLVQHLVHLGHHVGPVHHELASRGSRSAVCSTARSSVTLICSPANIASRRSASPTCSASSTRAASTSSLIRFLDRSTYRSPAVRLKVSARSGSAANQPRRSGSSSACSSVSVGQAAVVVGSTRSAHDHLNLVDGVSRSLARPSGSQYDTPGSSTTPCRLPHGSPAARAHGPSPSDRTRRASRSSAPTWSGSGSPSRSPGWPR